jgi:hypothetical protein
MSINYFWAQASVDEACGGKGPSFDTPYVKNLMIEQR